MRLRRPIIAAVFAAVVLALLFATGTWRWVWDSVLAVAQVVHDRYGVDVPVAIGLFGIGELLFCGSVAMMLREAGHRVSWRDIHAFKLRNLNLGSRRMLGWLWINRLSWIVPWLIVIGMSIGRVPWWATLAALGEVGITLGIGIVISLGLRLPWWNERNGSFLKKPQSVAGPRIRLATPEDVPAVARLEQEVWGDGAASEAQLTQRIKNVPRGNILAVAPDGRVCGFTSFCLLDYEAYESRGSCSWNDLSGDGTASTHVPGARDLFGINLGVARWAPRDTSIQLLGEVVREGIRVRARRGVLGARIPGYHKHADRMTAHEYWMAERRPGVPLDPELRFYRKFGMRPIRLVEEYFEDPESLNWGVLVEMKVPWYVSAAGPAIAALPIDLVAALEKIG